MDVLLLFSSLLFSSCHFEPALVDKSTMRSVVVVIQYSIRVSWRLRDHLLDLQYRRDQLLLLVPRAAMI